MIANLMMYQRPELVAAHNRYWQLIRDSLQNAGVEAPEKLSQDTEEFLVWNDPELVLSQTCGMPYRKWLHEKVTLVGTPDFGVADCPPAYYRSALVVRADDPRSTLVEFRDDVFAYNQTFSQSGYAAPYWHIKPSGFWFENLLHTHAHLESARAVAQGQASIASLDAVSWRLMKKYEPIAADLRVLEWTAPTPGLPLITAPINNPIAIFEAVALAISQLQRDDRTLLGLKGIVYIPKEKYLEVPNP